MKTNKKFRNVSIAILGIWLLFFAVVPLILVIVFSFLTRDEHNLIGWPLNFNNYKMIIDPLYFKVFLNSLSVSFITTGICLFFGHPFAYILSKLSRRWRDLALILVVIPFWTNSLVRTYGIRIIIGHNGILNNFLMKLGVIGGPLELLYTNFAVILGTVYIYFPFMVLPLYSSIEKLDQNLLEAAGDLGADRLSIFFKIVLPLTLPGIMAGCLLVFFPSLGTFYASDLLGGSKLLLLGSVVKGQFLEARDWPFGSAVSVSLTLVMSFMMAVYIYGRKRADPSLKESLS